MALRCFLVCLTVNYYLVAGQATEYFLRGETSSFTANIKETPDNILWKHGGNKVVEFTGSEQLSFGSFEHRVTLDWHSADLTISNLVFEDSGLYELEIFANSKLNRRSFQMEVIDKVAKPTISCNMHTASTSNQFGVQATLTCSSPSKYHQSLLTFQWRSDANMHLGPELMISLGGELDNHIYSCTVRNPLTEESAAFTAKDCYPDTSPAILIAAIVIPIVILLLSCVIFFIFYKKVYLKREKKSDMESQSASGIKNGASSDCEESRGLLDRVSTLPSKQTLRHLDQRNDDSVSDPTIQEKNINQDSKISSPSPAPDEPSFTISDSRAKENGKPYEAEPRDAVVENVLEDDPSDSEKMNETLPAEAAEHDDKVQMDADELGNDMEVKRIDPADSENGKDVLSGISDQHSPDKNKDEDNRASSPPEVPRKSNIVRNFSELQKEKDRNMQPKVVKRQNDPADSGNAIDKLAAGSDNQSLENKAEDGEISSPPPASPRLDHPPTEDKKQAEMMDNKEGDPVETNDASPDVPNDHSPDKNKDENNRASSPPEVPQKSNIVRNFSALQKEKDRNMQPKVVKRQTGPADSGDPNDKLAVGSDNQNSEKKKEEIESTKQTSENDVQPPPVAKENSPLSQNSPKISPKDEHKQDISSEELAGKPTENDTEESASLSPEEPENKEQGSPVATPEETDSESTENEQKPHATENESDVKTPQKM
ncbi:kinesin-related protein 12-like isoform X2 [Girardinichthys multiradiatus]|uniref:kinesin-related protein 12-like isoform X2 n=1 Tax=Girardinichthys multiradiatus TaxID=208333 RepID=UPI001FADB2A2|nr:kinesin-related protein 12-like isoform X2 [Girardinichthys multiradiatus]